jgi:hypothetical protein
MLRASEAESTPFPAPCLRRAPGWCIDTEPGRPLRHLATRQSAPPKPSAESEAWQLADRAARALQLAAKRNKPAWQLLCDVDGALATVRAEVDGHRRAEEKLGATNLDSRCGNSTELLGSGGEAVVEGASAPPGDFGAAVLVAGVE